MYQVTGNEMLHIIELKIYPETTNTHIYTLYVGDERPIYYNNNPILFFDLANAGKALNNSNCGSRSILEIPDDVYCVFDYYSVIKLLENSNIKSVVNAELLDCLNLLTDYCFDTMDFWTDSKKEKDFLADKTHKLNPDEIVYKVPVSFNTDIKQEYDFVKKVFAAAFYFTTETNIDQFFINENYERCELVKAIKFLIGHIATSVVIIN
ncbi:MAG: hypothetical protein LBC74_13740 [Planctomycetaceae bacterium]|jgi:hypothetical protein|nr:hypothetical protein [Planctomycetaceae bacterium]